MTATRAQSLEIRAAIGGDARGIADLHVRAWHVACASFVDQAVIAEAAEGRGARWAQVLGRSSDAGTWVAERRGLLLGFASGGASRDPDARSGDGELYALYVEPAIVGGGVGTALLRHAEVRLAERFAGATLWVFEESAPARSFYEHRGWAPDDRPGDRDRRDWAPCVRYRRALDG